MKTLIKRVRIIDETMDIRGSVLLEDGLIAGVFPQGAGAAPAGCGLILDGDALTGGGEPCLMPALVDLHAHFRDPGFPEKETLESASLAAAAGGYGTVVCMANTAPVIDTLEAALALKRRADALGLIDLYPALALTKGMAGAELSGLSGIERGAALPRLLSEDGKDVASDTLFLAALTEARRLGVPVSCHCDAGGPEAEAAKQRGQGREVWSRIEENNATQRAIRLGRLAGAHVHIAHVSTKEAAEFIRKEKQMPQDEGQARFVLTAEASPHHLALTNERAAELGAESHGRVNPPLRAEADRLAIIDAILDGAIDIIATDHAPHTETDKERGAPGFSGLETGFSVCLSALFPPDLPARFSLSFLSRLMSAAPARLLGLADRGRIAPGLRADLLLADIHAPRVIDPAAFKSRGKNSPFTGKELRATILATIHQGRLVFDGQAQRKR